MVLDATNAAVSSSGGGDPLQINGMVQRHQEQIC